MLRLLQDVADEVINPRFRDLAVGEVTEKGPGDLVTVADHEAEALITAALVAAYPDAVVLGEEAESVDASLMGRFREAEHAFTVDPVDGTKNFVAGSPDHAVMVSEIAYGRVVRGWIWQPQHRAAYVAERGGGAWHNGEPITRPPARPPLRGVTARRSWVGRTLGGLAPLELTWVCCGVDYPKLVEGAADFVLYRHGKPWDHGPGSLLLEEAGAFVGTGDGEAYQPQLDSPAWLVAAADRPTYDLVRALLTPPAPPSSAGRRTARGHR